MERALTGIPSICRFRQGRIFHSNITVLGRSLANTNCICQGWERLIEQLAHCHSIFPPLPLRDTRSKLTSWGPSHCLFCREPLRICERSIWWMVRQVILKLAVVLISPELWLQGVASKVSGRRGSLLRWSLKPIFCNAGGFPPSARMLLFR